MKKKQLEDYLDDDRVWDDFVEEWIKNNQDLVKELADDYIQEHEMDKFADYCEELRESDYQDYLEARHEYIKEMEREKAQE